MLATVLTCLIIGILSAIEVYVGQLVWPASQAFPDADTAYVYVAGRVGGQWLFVLVNLILLVASVGSGIGAQLGAARLLYGMGRSDALPRSFFGAVDRKRHIPRNNVLFVGVVAIVGAFLLSYSLGAEMLNFGALIAFMGVNAAAFVHYYLRGEQKKISDFVVPLLGIGICFLLWLNLSVPAKTAGAVWLLIGIAFGAWRTRGFRNDLIRFELPSDLE